MADEPVYSERLVAEAFAALTGAVGGDVQAAQRVLARVAGALARALPVRDSLYDPDLDGPPMRPEEITAAAVDARCFLELIAGLLGSHGEPNWMGAAFAFSGELKRRPGWKPPAAPTAAQQKRRHAASRVYELMAQQFFESGRRPKQEAAIATVMQEFDLARSKVMQGLKEYRESYSWMASCFLDGEAIRLPERELLARTHRLLLQQAADREWFRRNPEATFLGIEAGSDLENEMLSRKVPATTAPDQVS